MSDEIIKETVEPTTEEFVTAGKFCPSCGSKIAEKAVICPKCGVAIRTTGTRNPGTAAVLSALFTGLGQIYNGQIFKGILLMIIQVINVALVAVLIGVITLPLTWLYAVYDAYSTAKNLNERGE